MTAMPHGFIMSIFWKIKESSQIPIFNPWACRCLLDRPAGSKGPGKRVFHRSSLWTASADLSFLICKMGYGENLKIMYQGT